MPHPIHPMKKAFLLLATLLLTSPATLLSADATQPGKPNILFIMADDFGWTDLGCYGSKYHQTPNLDKLASRGVKFTQAYAANPLCSPTRSSVLTGLWPARTGITAPVCHLPQVILEKQLTKGNPKQPVLDALDECGIADKTIIVFFSDNGGVSWAGKDGDAEHKSAHFQADMKSPPTSNLPLRNGKASLYEGGVREPCLIVWPGIAEAGKVNDTVIQSIDWMPTLLDMVGVPLPRNVKPDGISITPAIQGGTLARDTIFTHFPHETPASGQHPGTSVRRGDWKLIRLFAQNDDGSDQFELFNIRDDLGETKRVAAEKPELVRELNSLITKFLADTEAGVPIRNPSYKPDEAKKPNAKAAADVDPLQGWKARSCEAVVKHGIVTMTGKGDAPFLGVGAGIDGPAKVSFRVRSTMGGAGKAEWIPSGGNTQCVHFQISAGDWQDISADIPATGPLGIFRLYLPAQSAPVELDRVELKGSEKSRKWDF